MTAEPLHPAPEELFAYRDGELPADRRALVETHVTACRACREQMDEMSKLEAALRARPDEVGDGYYERMQAQVMAKVHAAAPEVPVRAPARPTPLERRREEPESTERRGGAPKLPWIAIGSAVSAMAAVLVVVTLLVRSGGPPQMAVLERSAPDAARVRAGSADSAPPTLGSAPQAAVPQASVRAKERAGAAAPPPAGSGALGAADQVALAPEANAQKKDMAARQEARDQPLAKLETEPQTERAVPEKAAGLATSDEARVLQSAPMAAAPPAATGAPAEGGRFDSALSRYGLPPLWGPGVSDDLVLKAEPALRNLYRTGGATTALDSARVRLYLAEALRLRAGSAPDSAAIDEIAHHYRRAIRLGGADPQTVSTAASRLRDFLSEVGITP